MDTPRKRPRVVLFLAVSLLCFSSAQAQFPWSQISASNRSPNPPANCEMSGLVIDAGTGKPMARAEVMVFSDSLSGIAGGVMPVVVPTSPCVRCNPLGTLWYQIQTDATGHFALRKVEPGVYVVSVVAEGYADQVFKVQEKYMPTNAFWLRPGQRRDDIVVRLPRASVLAGRVIDNHGEPVPRSLVQVLQHGPEGARRKILEPVTGAMTDDSGKYRVFGLLPGRYYLVAGYAPDLNVDGAFYASDLERRFYYDSGSRLGAQWKELPPLYYYPHGTDPYRARPVDVKAGQTVVSLDIPVRPMTQAERAASGNRLLFPRLSGACEASGMVINALTGHPLRKTWLTFGTGYSLYQHPGVQSRTDGKGRFDLKSIPCTWSLPLAAWANGFVEQTGEPEFGGTYQRRVEPEFRPQPNVSGLLVRMEPAGVIAGKVTDAHGKPIECAHVTLAQAYPSSNDRRWMMPYQETVTDDRGRYRLFSLPAGQYYVAAQTLTLEPISTRPESPGDMGLFAVSPGLAASPYLYYPNATTPSEASVVRLAPGDQDDHIDFTLARVPTYEISGTVEGVVWHAAGGKVRLILLPAKGAFGISLQNGAVVNLGHSGGFRIPGVPSGSYVLWVTSPEGPPRYAGHAQVTVAHANVAGVTLDPQGGWTVHGHLSVEGQMRDNYFRFRYRIVAWPRDDAIGMPSVSSDYVQSGESFELKQMFPGSYRIRMEGLPQNGYIKSTTFGSQDLRTDYLEIPQHQQVGTLEIIASWDGARIQGTVLGPDGRPVPQATVILAPAPQLRSDPWLFKSGLTYTDGHFLLQGIAPGEYTLFAWNKVAYNAWLQPEFLESAAGHGIAVSVAAGQEQTVMLHEIVATGAASQ